ncbi:MAG: restriction endonuclease [Sphingobacteriales bacterium]|nr:MAG: restriction endonuclease [Sphingobacteriales bacterium]
MDTSGWDNIKRVTELADKFEIPAVAQVNALVQDDKIKSLLSIAQQTEHLYENKFEIQFSEIHKAYARLSDAFQHVDVIEQYKLPIEISARIKFIDTYPAVLNTDWMRTALEFNDHIVSHHSHLSKIEDVVGRRRIVTDERKQAYIEAFRKIEELSPSPEEEKMRVGDNDKLVSRHYDLSRLAETDGKSNIIQRPALIVQGNKLTELIADIYYKRHGIHELDSREFEEMIAELLYAEGCEVEVTKRTRDGGYDIIAISSMFGLPCKMLIECKRYAANRPVGVDIIRSFSHVISSENVNKGLLATTSYFTSGAVAERNKKPLLLDFRDQTDILAWIEKYAKKLNLR